MRHYNREEWMLFKKRRLAEEEYRKMEEHLYRCDRCLGTFLELINEEEINEATRKISPAFNKRVMAAAEKARVAGNHWTKARRSFAPGKLVGYYVACAVFTIVLTGAGLFQDLAAKAHAITVSATVTERIQYNVDISWASEIAKKTGDWMRNFEFGKGGFDFE